MEASLNKDELLGDGGITVGIDALSEVNQVQPEDRTVPKQSTSDEKAVGGDSPTPRLDVSQTRTCQDDKPSPLKSADFLSPKKSRRVSFPLDSTVVSGFMDPPNPWQDASTCTTDELITAYKAACEKHNVKPLPKLLNQLMAITNFCDRNETFTLKGEKLDAKHCETLEEVLRRVQFRTLDVENTHLDDESAVALFDMIEYYESCIKLNISYNKNIGLRGWLSCARMIKKTPCIDCLDARNCALTEQVMPMLGRALRMGSQLTILHLENAILSGRPLMILVTAIKMNELLRELYLADNKLMPSDGIQLGNMLKYNHRLQLLDVRNNHLQDVGTSHLCDGLYEQNLGQGLNTLVLWNNQVTYQSMPSVARSLVNTLSLETLNLGHNNITNEGIHRLKEGLLHNKSLLRIGLQASKISCEGAVALAEYIADSPRLLRVDLRENDIKTGGLMALSLSLKVSQTVTRVDLDTDTKKESGVKDYADQQKRLLQDIQKLMIRNIDLSRQRELEEELNRQAEAEAAIAELAAEEAKMEQQQQQQQALEAEAEAAADEVGEIGAAEQEVVLEEPVAETAVAEEEPSSDAEVTRPPHQLSLELPSRSQTLESPGFVAEADLPIGMPPTEEQVASEVAALTAAVATSDIPVDFPPSPMTSQPKSLLTTLTQEGAMSPKSGSPNTRRKFIISKVVEEQRAGPSTVRPGEADCILSSCTSGNGNNETGSASEEADVTVTEPTEAGAESAVAASSAANPAEPSGAEDLLPNESLAILDVSVSDGSGTASAERNGTASEAAPEDIDIELTNNRLETSPASGEPSLHGLEASTQSPDFHTNLSLNGMKVELATVLDNLEKKDLNFKANPVTGARNVGEAAE